MDSFLMVNETGEVNINGTECNTELEEYSIAVDEGNLALAANLYDQFLNCTQTIFLSLTKISESFTPSIRGKTIFLSWY